MISLVDQESANPPAWKMREGSDIFFERTAAHPYPRVRVNVLAARLSWNDIGDSAHHKLGCVVQ